MSAVLVVDSDETTLIDLQRVLEDAGFDTTVTWDIFEGKQLLSTSHFDLLLICDHLISSVPPGLVRREFEETATDRACMVVMTDQRTCESGQNGLAVSKRNHAELLRRLKITMVECDRQPSVSVPALKRQ